MPTRLVRIARLDQLAAGRGVAVAVAGDAIALFRIDGQTFAIDDACARCGSSLANGTLLGATVACAGCGWEYDVRTGAVGGVPAPRAPGVFGLRQSPVSAPILVHCNIRESFHQFMRSS